MAKLSSIYGIPAFTDNYIWLLSNEDQSQGVVVDPGDAQAVIEYLEANSIELSAILITHHHPDHIGGVEALVRGYQVPVYGPAKENIPELSQALKEDDEVYLEALDLKLKVLDVPGHTAGHIAYYSAAPEQPLLFCGDTLFSGGCGRLFEGTPEEMHASLAKFAKLPANTAVYCTHEYTQANLKFALAVEPENKALQTYANEVDEKRQADISTVPSTIGLELEINPFMRCNQVGVIKGAETHAGRSLKPGEEVLKAIRSWKDNF